MRSPNVKTLFRVVASQLRLAKGALQKHDVYTAREHATAAHIVAAGLPTKGRGRLRIGAAEILSDAFRAEGKLTDALPFARDVAEYDEDVLGVAHPITIHSTMSLAGILASTGSAPEAEQLLQRTSSKLQQLGSEEINSASSTAIEERNVTSPDCLKVDALLGRVLAMQGKLEQATGTMARNVDAARALYGERSSEHLRALADLSEALMDGGMLESATPILETLVHANLETYGSGSKQAVISCLRYADALEAQGKFLKSAQILMTQLGPSHPRSIKVITALRRLHGLGDATQSTHGAAKGCPGKQSCSSEQRAACKTPC